MDLHKLIPHGLKCARNVILVVGSVNVGAASPFDTRSDVSTLGGSGAFRARSRHSDGHQADFAVAGTIPLVPPFPLRLWGFTPNVCRSWALFIRRLRSPECGFPRKCPVSLRPLQNALRALVIPLGCGG